MKALKECEVIRQNADGVQIIRLVGPMDDYSIHRFQDTLNTLHRSGQNRLVVDCQDLDYLCTAGIELLVRSAKQARESHGDLLLARVPKKIQQIIGLLGHLNDLKIFDNVQEAVRTLTPPAPEKKT